MTPALITILLEPEAVRVAKQYAIVYVLPTGQVVPLAKGTYYTHQGNT
jgi:hypothetical protein